MGGGYSGLDGLQTKGRYKPSDMNKEKQKKHVPNSKNYVPGKSIITIPLSELDELVKKHIDQGIAYPNGRITIIFPKIIGRYIDGKGDEIDTNRGTYHPSKTGYHIVPSDPIKRRR